MQQFFKVSDEARKQFVSEGRLFFIPLGSGEVTQMEQGESWAPSVTVFVLSETHLEWFSFRISRYFRPLKSWKISRTVRSESST